MGWTPRRPVRRDGGPCMAACRRARRNHRRRLRPVERRPHDHAPNVGKRLWSGEIAMTEETAESGQAPLRTRRERQRVPAPERLPQQGEVRRRGAARRRSRSLDPHGCVKEQRHDFDRGARRPHCKRHERHVIVEMTTLEMILDAQERKASPCVRTVCTHRRLGARAGQCSSSKMLALCSKPIYARGRTSRSRGNGDNHEDQSRQTAGLLDIREALIKPETRPPTIRRAP